MPRELPMDLLNDSTKEVVYRRKNSQLFKKIAEVSHFSEREVKGYNLYYHS